MSEAFDKNRIALERGLGATGLHARLQTSRIGIWSAEGSGLMAGSLLAEALGDILGRFWLRIDSAGPLAELLISSSRAAAASGNQQYDHEIRWQPPYDAVISIGVDAPPNVGPVFRIGANGWSASVGPHAVVTDNNNPVGPFATAAITAAELFKHRFADALGDRARSLPPTYEWSAWDYGLNLAPPHVQALNLGNLVIFGVGAVTHSLLWLILRWPASVTGTVRLVDQDSYGESNGQRYVGMRNEDLGNSKVLIWEQRLSAVHSMIDVTAHRTDMNNFYEQSQPNCNVPLAIVGVDSAEHRRQLALKLPRRVVNMWTEREWLGAARFGFDDDWPCLFCVYPEDMSGALDETGQLFSETGILPGRVRELLDSGAGLTEADALIIAQKYSIEPGPLVGKPLRTARGILCATARIKLPESGAEVDVPLPFSSAMAGIGGFVELVREIWSVSSPAGKWKLRSYAYPVPGNWETAARSTSCYLCSDRLTHEILRDKYPA